MNLHKLALGTAVIAGALMLIALVATGVRTSVTHAAGDCTVSDTTFDEEERRFAVLINDYRRSLGLPELTVSENLNRMAAWHAKDMADKRYFSHEDSLGRRAEQRGADCGTTTKIGENIAAGPARWSAQNVFDAWKASAGHDKNMRNAGYQQIGVARYYKADSEWGWYWVTNFSLNSDNTNLLSIDLGIINIGIGVPPLVRTSTPTVTPTRTATPSPTATATRTPTPTPTPVQAAARLTSPQPGSTLPGTSVTFNWTSVSGASNYQLYIGTTPGGYDVRNVRTTNTSLRLTGLPRVGQTLYLRLWTQVGTTWRYHDYTVTSAR